MVGEIVIVLGVVVGVVVDFLVDDDGGGCGCLEEEDGLLLISLLLDFLF